MQCLHTVCCFGLFHLFQKKTQKVKVRCKRIKFRKRYIFRNSCAWQNKKRPMSSHSAISMESHSSAGLLQAIPASAAPRSWDSLILQWAGTAVQRDGHQPDMWPSPAGIPLAACLWPYARLILFLFWFSFVSRRDFSLHEGFSKESQQGKPYQCPEASKEKSEIHKQGNDLVREKNH